MTDCPPLSILQIVSSPWLTGAASATLGLSCVLRDLGHRVILAAIPGNRLEEQARNAGLTFEGLLFNRRLGLMDFLKDRKQVRKILRRESIDILHTHLSHDHWTAVSAGGKESPLVVRTFHLVRHIRCDLFHRRFCYERTNGFFSVSENIRVHCEKEARIPKARTFALRGTVDTDFFKPGTGNTAIRKRLGLTSAGPVVGTVSRLAPNRGHLSLLEAFVQVRAKFPEAQLLLTGKGEYRETIIQRAKTLGLQPGREVILTGYWDGDLRDILSLLDVFVLQSAGSEGTARALLEAMACGLPTVVTRTDGMDDIVEDETSGIVVPPSDPEALSTKLISLLQDQNRAKIIGQRARERAISEFDQWVQAKRVETAYRMLLNSFREK